MSIAAGTCSITPDFSAVGTVTRTAGTPSSPEPVSVFGQPTGAVSIAVQITSTDDGTGIGEARYRWSADGGATWATEATIPDAGILDDSAIVVAPGGQTETLGSTGLRLRFADVSYAVGDAWSYVLAHAIGFPVVAGSGFAFELATAEAALWWAPLAIRPSLPDPFSDVLPVTNAAIRTLYETQCNTLATRCNALAAVYAPRLS